MKGGALDLSNQGRAASLVTFTASMVLSSHYWASDNLYFWTGESKSTCSVITHTCINMHTQRLDAILTVLWLLVPPPMLLCVWADCFQCSCMSRCVLHISSSVPHTLCSVCQGNCTIHMQKMLLVTQFAYTKMRWVWFIAHKLAFVVSVI